MAPAHNRIDEIIRVSHPCCPIQNRPPRRVDNCLARPEVSKLPPMERTERRLVLLIGRNE
ncbi:MAG: hypothetical protein ACYSU4_15765 [Planctomycetota bacterium]